MVEGKIGCGNELFRKRKAAFENMLGMVLV